MSSLTVAFHEIKLRTLASNPLSMCVTRCRNYLLKSVWVGGLHQELGHLKMCCVVLRKLVNQLSMELL